MMNGSTAEKKEIKSQDLIDLVFSWSIQDIMNKSLFADKVKQIPETFDSTDHYLKSFIDPLIEETRADLCSSLTTIWCAPTCEVLSIRTSKSFSPPDCLLYKVNLNEKESGRQIYDPEIGDLFALTDVQPECIDDLNRPKIPWTIAIIERKKQKKDFIEFHIVSSRLIEYNKKGGRLYAVYLDNLTTNIRIWKALHTNPEVANMNVIKNVLQAHPRAGDDCAFCSSGTSKEATSLYSREAIHKLGLDSSQESAVFSCLATEQCQHRNTVKLIWGPPGTGKTKTVASLLCVLFQMKCRTLTCAPTNVAVLGVASRVMNLVRPSLEFDTHGLGDIVLFGNGERMKIDDHDELFDIFLDYRVACLYHCFLPLSGWRGRVQSMIQLLEDPDKQYKIYLRKEMENESDGEDPGEQEEKMLANMNSTGSPDRKEEVRSRGLTGTAKKALLKKVILQSLEENEKKSNKKVASSKKKNARHGKSSAACNRKVESRKTDKPLLTFEEFFMREFDSIGENIYFCITSLYTHLPTSLIQVGVAKRMIGTVELLQTLGGLFHQFVGANERLAESICGFGPKTSRNHSHKLKLKTTRAEFLQELKFLRETIILPNLIEKYEIERFCLENACLYFSTSSSSAKLHKGGMMPLELLIIDEAAQLKECESLIPLQLYGIRHAVLIGDEKQLPAMVRSEACEMADFGRSLFERLVILGHQKHLLNVQYRMHPSISIFPNKEFYGGLIEDGSNVKHENHRKQFIGGLMYGSYSFIDITCGKEEFDERTSRKNVIEASVVSKIISKLHKESIGSKNKLRVGCISPYKAQVLAIQEELGKKYSTDAYSKFSVNVRSVDGFQGGEEDVIIVSTVRCNASGSVGFLSNHQRTNVALTRARHCLWILGNSNTLMNSCSIWGKLVTDAIARGCFFSVNEDEALVHAILCSELKQFGNLQSFDSLLLKSARWKVCFSDEFLKSLNRIHDSHVHEEVISLIQKLSSGWRPSQKDKILQDLSGPASLLLELCNVEGDLKLIWIVAIQRQNALDIQVIKILDVLPCSKIREMAAHLNQIFEDYTIRIINRCMFKQFEGNLIVPMQWPVESYNMRNIYSAYHDPNGKLATQLGSMSLQDDRRRSTKASRYRAINYNKKGGRGQFA